MHWLIIITFKKKVDIQKKDIWLAFFMCNYLLSLD